MEKRKTPGKFLKNYNSEVVKIFFNHFKFKILDFGAGIWNVIKFIKK